MVVERVRGEETGDEGFPRGGETMSKGMVSVRGQIGNCHICLGNSVGNAEGSNRRHRFKRYFETSF